MKERFGNICIGMISLVTILLGFLSPANATGSYQFTAIMIGTQTVGPFGINDAGQIVGGYDRQGIILNGSSYNMFNVPGTLGTTLTGINNSGEVVGIYNPAGALSSNSTFLLSNNTFTPITMAGAGIIGAYGINNLGQVVGSFSAGYSGDSSGERGFIYSGGNFTYISPFGMAFRGINDKGQICGEAVGLNAAWTGFLYSGGVFTYFNVPNAYSTAPQGINNLGQIVGYYDDSTGLQHGFLRNSDGTFITIDGPDGIITTLNGINNLGQIVGWTDSKGFVATPTAITVTIDIRPWSKLNPINYKSRGVLPVAILSTDDFDAPNKVDQNSLTFGAAGDEKSLAFCNRRPKDIARDGSKDDLVCHFFIEVAGFECGDTEGILKGKTMDGVAIEGKDLVKIINCKKTTH